MTVSLVRSLNEATDSLGPEHSVAVRTARASLRCTYLHARSMVTGTTQFDPVDLADMDRLDAMVGRWMSDAEASRRIAQSTKNAVAAAVDPDTAA